MNVCFTVYQVKMVFALQWPEAAQGTDPTVDHAAHPEAPSHTLQWLFQAPCLAPGGTDSSHPTEGGSKRQSSRSTPAETTEPAQVPVHRCLLVP